MTQFPAASLTCIDFRSGTEWGHITTWSEGFLKEHLSCDKGEKKLVKELNARHMPKSMILYILSHTSSQGPFTNQGEFFPLHSIHFTFY
jgi:hypothetical protein